MSTITFSAHQFVNHGKHNNFLNLCHPSEYAFRRQFRDPLNPLLAPPARYKYHSADSSDSGSDQSDEEGAGIYPDSQVAQSQRRPAWRQEDVQAALEGGQTPSQMFTSVRVVAFVGDVGHIWRRGSGQGRTAFVHHGVINLQRGNNGRDSTSPAPRRSVLRWFISPPVASDGAADLTLFTVERIPTAAVALVSQEILSLARSFVSE